MPYNEIHEVCVFLAYSVVGGVSGEAAQQRVRYYNVHIAYKFYITAHDPLEGLVPLQNNSIELRRRRLFTRRRPRTRSPFGQAPKI